MQPPFLHRWLSLALVTLAALWLRLHDLADRPMHADEANQAVKLGQLLETGDYTFDPRDHHGPTLYYAAVPIAWLRGETTLAALTETTVRLVPALFGTLSVLLLALLAQPASWRRSHESGASLPTQAEFRQAPGAVSSHWLPLSSAAFFALSPPAIYYSRYFVQETLLVTFTLGAFVCAQRWWWSRHLGWALAAGACVGLMQATKASTPLFLAAAVLAGLVARWITGSRRNGHAQNSADKADRSDLVRDPVRTPRKSSEAMPASSSSGAEWPAAHSRAMPSSRPATARIARDLALATLAAVVVAAVFYSSFGTHPAGLRDAFATYTIAADRAAAGAGHEKPWWYYLRLLGWHREGGLVWNQLPFTALALCGAALAVLLHRTHKNAMWHSAEPPEPGGNDAPSASADPAAACATTDETRTAQPAPTQNLLIATLLYTVLLATALSAIPYKTPWHIIHLVPGLALLAGSALAALAQGFSSFAAPDAVVSPSRPARSQTQPRFRLILSPLLAALIFAAVAYSVYAQTRLAVFLRPADARNPYAYVHSSPDVKKFRTLAEAALAGRPANAIVRVISEEYWPLPWYFRGLENVGYWAAPPENCDAALVIASATFAETVRGRLNGSYRESYLGLRPGFLCVVFTPEP